MYIIELIAKLSTKIKNRDFKFLNKEKPEQIKEEQKCEHIFVPIDSTKKILACTKCGFMIRVNPDKIKKQNPFKE